MRVDFYAWSELEGKATKPFFTRRGCPLSDVPQKGWQITFVLVNGESPDDVKTQKFGEVADVEEEEGFAKAWMDMGEEFIHNLKEGLVRVVRWSAMVRFEKQKA